MSLDPPTAAAAIGSTTPSVLKARSRLPTPVKKPPPQSQRPAVDECAYIPTTDDRIHVPEWMKARGFLKWPYSRVVATQESSAVCGLPRGNACVQAITRAFRVSNFPHGLRRVGVDMVATLRGILDLDLKHYLEQPISRNPRDDAGGAHADDATPFRPADAEPTRIVDVRVKEDVRGRAHQTPPSQHGADDKTKNVIVEVWADGPQSADFLRRLGRGIFGGDDASSVCVLFDTDGYYFRIGAPSSTIEDYQKENLDVERTRLGIPLASLKVKSHYMMQQQQQQQQPPPTHARQQHQSLQQQTPSGNQQTTGSTNALQYTHGTDERTNSHYHLGVVANIKPSIVRATSLRSDT